MMNKRRHKNGEDAGRHALSYNFHGVPRKNTAEKKAGTLYNPLNAAMYGDIENMLPSLLD